MILLYRMTTLRQQRDPGRLLLRRIGLLGLLIAVAFAASGVWGVYQKERDSAILRAQAEGEYAELSDRETRLREELTRLKTDRGMEEALRGQYALAEEGEGLIVIVEPPTPPPLHATSSVMDWFKNAFSWW